MKLSLPSSAWWRAQLRPWVLVRYVALFGMAVSLYLLVQAWAKAFHPPRIDPVPVPIEGVVRLENKDVAYEISLQGGDVVQSTLLQEPIQLGSNQGRSLLSPKKVNYQVQVGLSGVGLDSAKQRISYQSDKTVYKLQPGDDAVEAKLTYQTPEGVKIVRTYRLEKEGYLIHMNLEVDNPSSKEFQASLFAQMKHRNISSQDQLMLGGSHYGFAAYTSVDGYQNYDFDELSESELNTTLMPDGWIGFTQHYYVSALALPKAFFAKHPARSYGKLADQKDQNNELGYIGIRTEAFSVPSGQKLAIPLKLYSGPKQGKALSAIEGLNDTISYGWLSPISKLFLWMMTHFEALFGNWGVAIILLTMVIKIVLFPLNQMSYRSMAKLRALMPKMQSLREQHANDRQALAKETMLLYRKEKVNPAGGCFPLLMQIPIFLALFWMIRASVEIRGEPFMLWIHDLSVLDPYFILPILMGFTMILQQRLSPLPSDPTQARVLKLMPYAFTIFFLWFPSALTLYWVVNNTLTVIQQLVIKRQIDKEMAKKGY